MVCKKSAFSLVVCSFLAIPHAAAQSFSVVSAGELELGTNNIVVDGVVSEYFGMNVLGVGDSILRVKVGDVSAERSYEFKVSETRLFSYFVPNNLANVAGVFRPGVRGNVTIDILGATGELSATVPIQFNARLPRRNCRKTARTPAVKCVLADLGRLNQRTRKKFAAAFLSSIKGPIVLEP